MRDRKKLLAERKRESAKLKAAIIKQLRTTDLSYVAIGYGLGVSPAYVGQVNRAEKVRERG